MEVERLAEGLWWWTGRIEGRGETASLYVESATAVSLLDPVLPPEDRQRFLRALDRDVKRHGGRVDVFLTSQTKRAFAGDLIERYDARVRDGSTDDVELVADGTMLWLPEHRTLFSGDALVATEDGRLITRLPDGLPDAVEWIVSSSGRPVAFAQ